MTNQTLISIILPVYNAEPFLVECLNSILNQSHQNWHLIAINDGSTDKSLSILEKYAKKDSRIKIFSNHKNRGIASSLNRALKHTKSKFIARMDADDICYKHRLKNQLAFLQNNPDHIIVGGQCTLTNQAGKKIGKKTFPTKHKDIYQLAFLRTPLQHPAVMINSSLLPQNFIWYKQGKVPAEDLELFFRLFRFGKAANLPHTVLKYRQIHNGLTLNNIKKTFQTAQKVRHQAVSLYGYKPNLITSFLHLLQTLIVYLLPSQRIYQIYRFAINPKFKAKLPKYNFTFPKLSLPSLLK